jgi:hypothetical protein
VPGQKTTMGEGELVKLVLASGVLSVAHNPCMPYISANIGSVCHPHCLCPCRAPSSSSL